MSGQPVVAVWRAVLGAPSETFVVNQAAALRRYRPVMLGTHRAEPSLPLGEHLLLDGDQQWGRLRRSALWRLGWEPGLQRVLSRPSVALVHAHFVTDALAVRTAARLARCPLVFTAHGYDVSAMAAALTRSPRRSGWHALVRQAAAVIAVSDHIAGRLESMGVPGEKITVRHIGIPVPPPPGDGPRHAIVFVGRLVEKKGCDDLLRAVAALDAGAGPTPVRIVGDGPDRAALEALARRLGVDATFVGRQPPDVVAAELRAARVFCAPSKTAADGDVEGFGMVFLEAAAAGTPVVTYASGGTPEAVADGVTGLLAREGDVADLTRALAAVLDDDALAARLGAAGRRRVVGQFDIGPLTAALEDVYDRVARRTP